MGGRRESRRWSPEPSASAPGPACRYPAPAGGHRPALHGVEVRSARELQIFLILLRMAAAHFRRSEESAFHNWAQQPVRPMQSHRHVLAGKMQAVRDLVGREILDVAEPHDLTKRRWQLVDHLQQHARQLASVRRGFRRRGVGKLLRPTPKRGRSAFLVVEGYIAASGHRTVRDLMPHNRRHPGACWRASPVLPELLQHDNPAFLQRIVSPCVIARNTAGERQKPGRAAPDPCLNVLFQQRTPDSLFDCRSRRLAT